MSCDIKAFISEVKSICKEDNILEVCSLLCSKYVFVEDEKEKNNLMSEIMNGVNNREVYNIVKYILNINIIIENENMVFTQWLIINGFIKRKEYLLNSKDKNELIFLKDYNPIKISELIK